MRIVARLESKMGFATKTTGSLSTQVAVLALLPLLGCRTQPFAERAIDGGVDLRAPADLFSCRKLLNEPPTPGSINCNGSSPSDQCPLPSVCRYTFSGYRHCEPRNSGSGGGSWECDGPEDCTMGQTCCFALGLVASQDTTYCGGSGNAECSPVCHSAIDCGPGRQCYVESLSPSGLCGRPGLPVDCAP